MGFQIVEIKKQGIGFGPLSVLRAFAEFAK